MSFERILVPLDGSKLAEAILPAAEAVAAALGSVLLLVHALEPEPPAAVHGEAHLASAAAAEEYLRRQRDRCRARGLSAELDVREPSDIDVAGAIGRLAVELDAGLIAMCAHGRQTLRDRLLGRIAQRILRGGPAPVMLRTAGAPPNEPFKLDRILVPVDFRHDLELAIDAARMLAGPAHASVTLLHASGQATGGLPARMLPNTSTVLTEVDRQAAQDRLTRLADALAEQGIAAEATVSEHSAGDAILATAAQRDADLIVLTTHARSGVAGWYERSIGRQMVAEPGLTLLLLREEAPA